MFFMPDDRELSATLRWTLVALLVCTVLVVFCYYYVDQRVAYFVHDHRIPRFEELRWLTEPPPLVQFWAPVVIALLAVRRGWGPWRRWQHVLFVACISLIVADQFRESLGDMFGRYWPETWHNHNLSLIGTGTYGFHPFKVGDDIGSFPSGHAARLLAFASVFWIAVPRWRWLYAVIAAPMLIALVAMDYHFVGDVIAGSVLGGIVGAWASRLCDLP